MVNTKSYRYRPYEVSVANRVFLTRIRYEAEGGVKEMSIDGGKVRLRTDQGHPSEWRDHKGDHLIGVTLVAIRHRAQPLERSG